MAAPTHHRTLVRNAIKANIIAAKTLAGSRVYTNRMQPIFPKELPCILVYCEDEPAEVAITAPRQYYRNLSVSVEVLASADDGVDDTLDTICAQLEQCIFTDETFGDIVVDTILTGTEISIIDTGDKPLGSAKIKLEMPYRTDLPASPAQPLDNLVTADVKFQDSVAGGELLSEDTVTLPTS